MLHHGFLIQQHKAFVLPHAGAFASGEYDDSYVVVDGHGEFLTAKLIRNSVICCWGVKKEGGNKFLSNEERV